MCVTAYFGLSYNLFEFLSSNFQQTFIYNGIGRTLNNVYCLVVFLSVVFVKFISKTKQTWMGFAFCDASLSPCFLKKMEGYSSWLQLADCPSVICHTISSEMVVQKFTKLRGYDHHMVRRCKSNAISGPAP